MMEKRKIKMVVVIVVVLSIIIGYNMMSNSEAILSLLSISENNLTGPLSKGI
jgi:hypothetical protein